MQKTREDLCSHSELQGTNQNRFLYFMHRQLKKKKKCILVELEEKQAGFFLSPGLSALKIQKV